MRKVVRYFIILFMMLVTMRLSASDSLYSHIHISILTCAPGQELYSLYGHNAIRVADRETGADLVYNYGTFDFNTPNFAIKFMRGRLPYLLSVSTYSDFLREYVYFQRAVVEQELMLSLAEKEKILAYLDRNMLPENRAYKYDFFHDNCATRLRDIINVAVPKLAWQATDQEAKSFRQIIKEYQKEWPWTDFGIDLIIGASADRVADVQAQAFIPDYLSKALTIVHRPEGNNQLLQYNRLQILDYPAAAGQNQTLPGPFWVFVFLLIVEVFLFVGLPGQKMKRYIQWYDKVWYILLIAAAILMSIMWLATDHIATKQNWNLLWANPLIFIWPWVKNAGERGRNIFLVSYAGFCMGALVNALPGCFFLPQYFHIAVAPICAILLLKVARIYKN